MRPRLELACLAVVAAAQIALFTRLLATSLDFDEGVYLLGLDALRSGQQLGTDVFAAQPPVFYGILRLLAAVLGTEPEHVRLGIAFLSLVGTGAAWLLARSIAGPVAGVLAAAFLTISPPIPLFASRILADLPSLWLALAALALGAVASRRGSSAAAAGAGTAAAVAVLTKPSALLVIPMLVLILLPGAGGRARRMAWAGAGAAGAATAVLLANIGANRALWDGVVTYHRKAGSTPAVIDRWASIGDLFNPRTPILWLVVAGAAVFGLRVVRRQAWLGEIALWGWALVAFAFLATYAPLHYNHLVALPVPLAVAAATSLGAQVASASPGRRKVAGALLLITIVAAFAQQWRRVAIADEPQSRKDLTAAEVLRRVTRPGDLVVSDLPVSAVLARREVPGPLIDTAYLRFETGSLTPGRVLGEVDRWCVAAVVVGRSFEDEPAVVHGLRQRFSRAAEASGATVLYDRRTPCTPRR